MILFHSLPWCAATFRRTFIVLNQLSSTLAPGTSYCDAISSWSSFFMPPKNLVSMPNSHSSMDTHIGRGSPYFFR